MGLFFRKRQTRCQPSHDGTGKTKKAPIFDTFRCNGTSSGECWFSQHEGEMNGPFQGGSGRAA
jgi:hypothetical protein